MLKIENFVQPFKESLIQAHLLWKIVW